MSLKPVSDAVATAAARQVWEYIYPEPWPEDWVVRWEELSHLSIDGDCDFRGKLIRLNWGLKRWNNNKDGEYEVLYTLVHEFTHLRNPRLHHGEGFTRRSLVDFNKIVGDPRMDELVPGRAAMARDLREVLTVRRENRRQWERVKQKMLALWWLHWQVEILTKENE